MSIARAREGTFGGDSKERVLGLGRGGKWGAEEQSNEEDSQPQQLHVLREEEGELKMQIGITITITMN